MYQPIKHTHTHTHRHIPVCFLSFFLPVSLCDCVLAPQHFSEKQLVSANQLNRDTLRMCRKLQKNQALCLCLCGFFRSQRRKSSGSCRGRSSRRAPRSTPGATTATVTTALRATEPRRATSRHPPPLCHPSELFISSTQPRKRRHSPDH